jgi:hypothetical protein
VHGIPDQYTEARAWHLAAHRAKEHGEPLTAEQIAYGNAKGHKLPQTPTNTPALSPEREQEIRARAEAATPGPWCTDSWEIYQGAEYEPGISQWIGETCRGATSPEQDRADADFIARAREDVPALLAELARVRAERDALVKLHDWDELIFGGFYCTHCTPDDADEEDQNVYWPCPSLRTVGMTDEEANEIIRAHRAAIEAAAKRGESR